MELASPLATQIIGIALATVSAGLIFNSDQFLKMGMDFMKSPSLIYLGGLMSLILGLLIVLTHGSAANIGDIIVCIFGYGATIKGVILIVFPGFMKSFTEKMLKSCSCYVKYIGAAYLALGGYLIYISFCA